MRPSLCWLSFVAVVSVTAEAQSVAARPFAIPTTNPPSVVRERIAATDIEINYHRPSVKGRTIFGALVPWGQIWRTGSDNATTIAFSTPVRFGDAALDAGTYELFTLPGQAEWTVIIHRHRSQWGSYAYDAAHDVARVRARPTPLSPPVETFTIAIDDIRPGAGALSISWEQTRVSVPIQIDVRATAVPGVEAALTAAGRKPYFTAAMFYYENDLDIDRAAELIALAVAESPQHVGILHRQALILAKKGDRAGAIAAAEKSLAGAAQSPRELRDEYTRLNAALLDRLRERRGPP